MSLKFMSNKFNLEVSQPIQRPGSIDLSIFVTALNEYRLSKDIINIIVCTDNPPALFLLHLVI